MPKPAVAPSSRVRRGIASLIDAGLLFVLAIIWFHWVQWAQYTETFSRQWPPQVAMPAVTLIPITVLWLEAISGRGLGKLIAGLRVIGADGTPASLGLLLGRALLKWSPLLVGVACLLIGTLSHSTFADAFASDRLVPLATFLADHLPGRMKPVAWMLEQAMRTVNFGVIPLVILAIGEMPAYTRSRSLLDAICKTTVRSAKERTPSPPYSGERAGVRGGS